MTIYKRGRGFELGTTENKSSKWAGAGLEPRTPGLRVPRADHSATLPRITGVQKKNPLETCGD